MTVVAVFGASIGHPGEAAYDAAAECGRLLARSGYAVATGGYGGLMEAVSRGAAEVGGHVIGVTAPEAFPDRPGANPWVHREIPAPTITERIHRIISGAAAVIALDGSIGTLTELVVAWNLAFVQSLSGGPALPVIAVGRRWERVVAWLAEAVETDRSLVTCAPDVATAVAEVRRRLETAANRPGPG